jgi:hypothetical protein
VIELPRTDFERLHALGFVRSPDEPDTRPPGSQDGSAQSLGQSGKIGSISYPQ